MKKLQALQSLTDQNFQTEVLEYSKPVLVEVEADWCGTCHIMAPILEKLAHYYEGRIKFGRIDIEANEKIARDYGVSELPFLLFFKDGRLVDHVIGALSEKALDKRLKTLLSNSDLRYLRTD